jgi:hypothetical protein
MTCASEERDTKMVVRERIKNIIDYFPRNISSGGKAFLLGGKQSYRSRASAQLRECILPFPHVTRERKTDLKLHVHNPRKQLPRAVLQEYCGRESLSRQQPP